MIEASLIRAIDNEITRGNSKHGHAPLATPEQTCIILIEEIGEYAQAILQGRYDDAKAELLQVAAVAMNQLMGTGPHCSSL